MEVQGWKMQIPPLKLFYDPVKNGTVESHGCYLDGSSNALLGISNSVMLAEITANRVPDQIDLPE
ncbi:hypothetical protein D3C75_920630 [compost metagenome]